MERVPVFVAAAGSRWETEAIELLSRPGSGVVLLKRCVDLHDLMATAATGLGRCALVSGSLAGLDGDAVAHLRREGLGVVLVDDLSRGVRGGHEDAARLRRLDASGVLDADGLAVVAEAVRAAADQVDQQPEVPPVTDKTGENVPRAPETGCIAAVWGPAGAPGRTTVAVGVAAELARRGHDTLLVDADPYAGAVAQHLGVLDEVSGLLAAARAANSGSLDAARLASYARHVGDRLRVLTGLPRADRWTEVRPHAFEELMVLASSGVDRVVLDTGFSLERTAGDPFEQSVPGRNTMTVSALEHADEVLVVGAADPVGLARLARALVELHDLLPQARPRVVVNRTRASLGWGEREVRGMVEGFVSPAEVHFLPDDRAAADRALMAGRSLVESGDSPLRTALAGVVDAMLGASGASVRRRRAGRAR